MINKINNFQIVALLLSSLLFVSCEKVIDIDMKDSKSTIVIEGEINEGDSLHTIRIT